MDNSEIYLKNLVNAKKKDYLKVSKELAKENNSKKLDCTGVDSLSKIQLDLLFSHVTDKNNLRIELNKYIKVDTVNESLNKILIEYVESQLKSNNLEDLKLFKPKKSVLISIIFLATLLCLGIFTFKDRIYINNKNQLDISVSTNKYELDTDSLTIGVLGEVERYEPLVEYLQSELGSSVDITIDGYDGMPYQLAINRIQLKQWDVAFTLSPNISIAAEDSNYQRVARMFPNYPPNYQSVMFVKKDSDIQSMDDITLNTVIALGSDDSASSFYMPIYYLYGRKLIIDDGHRGKKIKELVRNGDADIGAGAFNDLIKWEDLNDLKIISQSMNIPGSSVYVSPTLSESDRKILSMLLNNAPDEVKNKDKANYGDPETNIDYSGFRELVKSVERIITCADFTVNPVSLFCNSNQNYSEIEGKVQDWQSQRNEYILTIIDSYKLKHKVCLDRQIAAKIIGEDNPISVKNKRVRVKYVSQQHEKCIRINNPLQIKILPL